MLQRHLRCDDRSASRARAGVQHPLHGCGAVLRVCEPPVRRRACVRTVGGRRLSVLPQRLPDRTGRMPDVPVQAGRCGHRHPDRRRLSGVRRATRFAIRPLDAAARRTSRSSMPPDKPSASPLHGVRPSARRLAHPHRVRASRVSSKASPSRAVTSPGTDRRTRARPVGTRWRATSRGLRPPGTTSRGCVPRREPLRPRTEAFRRSAPRPEPSSESTCRSTSPARAPS